MFGLVDSFDLVDAAQMVSVVVPGEKVLLTLCTIEIGIILVNNGVWLADVSSWRLDPVHFSQVGLEMYVARQRAVAFGTVMIGVVDIDFCVRTSLHLGYRLELRTMCLFAVPSVGC